ncbi:MAG: alpha/beta fold hydrolase [Acidobacteriota bacterium]|nr:alpha/beta fold hydrolase [Acidobacteriota bacterium]
MQQKVARAALVDSGGIHAAQRNAFAFALTVGSRAIHVRDKVLGRIPACASPPDGLALNRLRIASGRNELDAAFAAPAKEQTRATVLICHGIGEVVVQWQRIQLFMAACGIASLVFDYSGYGRSTGWPTPKQLENDAIAAHARLSEFVPGPISLLGFSLGTGIVPAILNRVQAHRLVLCAGFTGFRAAARRVCIPPFLTALVPPVWESEPALRAATQPILFVHSTGDRLFPIAMAEEMARWCGDRARLNIFKGLSHNEPFYKPTAHYWQSVADFLLAEDPDLLS